MQGGCYAEGMTENQYRTIEALANERATELLKPFGTTIATMTAEQYDAVKAQLKREKLWQY